MKRILMSIVSSIVFVFTAPLNIQGSPLAYPVERISGTDRVETAIKIAQEGWDTANIVILCEYSDYPDSIAATPYATSLDAPILLTRGDRIDARVVKELERLKPDKVILLGGTGCLKASIEDQLENELELQWERIGGKNRYETSILLARNVTNDTLILANGDNFPDALSAASFAGIQQIPIILTSKAFPDSVIEYIEEMDPKKIIVIGGEGVIPTTEMTKHSFKIHARLGGANRYETNTKVVSYIKDIYETDDLFLASGITFPDAVAGTVLASKYKAPLLLTEKNDIPPTVYAYMRGHMKVEPPRKLEKPESDVRDVLVKEGKITASGGLNLRESPSPNGKILATIPLNAKIEILDEKDDWLKTTYQSKTGWVSKNYVELFVQKGIIEASGGLNLRQNPSPSAEILTTIPKDTIVEILTQESNWYKIKIDSWTGWVSVDYVKLIQEETSAPSAIAPINIDLSPNGIVYILGGVGVISDKTQSIIEGKSLSNYKENQREFPALPAEIKKPDPPSRGDDKDEPPLKEDKDKDKDKGQLPNDDESKNEDEEHSSDEEDEEYNNEDEDEDSNNVEKYDPSIEVLVDPFDGIPPYALEGKVIMIDPGHGGPDTGAIGPTKTYEKTNTLAIALELKDILDEAGATPILTRAQDISPAPNYTELADLKARVNLANTSDVDLFISIHNDSFTNPDVKGTSTFYSSANPRQLESLHLANSIQTSMIDIIQTNNRGVKEAGFYVIKNTEMPSVLVEVAFISSPYEEQRLQNSTFRKNVAAAIFRGIYKYYNTPLPKD